MPRRAIPRWAPDVERLRSTGLSPGTEQGVQRRGQLDSQVADIVDGLNGYGSGAGRARSGAFDAGRAEEMYGSCHLAQFWSDAEHAVAAGESEDEAGGALLRMLSIRPMWAGMRPDGLAPLGTGKDSLPDIVDSCPDMLDVLDRLA